MYGLNVVVLPRTFENVRKRNASVKMFLLYSGVCGAPQVIEATHCVSLKKKIIEGASPQSNFQMKSGFAAFGR